MLHRALFVAAGLLSVAPAQSFHNFESGPVSPLRIAADGTRLFVADTTGDRLCVFDLHDPSAPFLLAEIPVGLDPVSVHPRSGDEVWVTNLLSDTVDIVDVARRQVVASLRVGDEPSDIVFAGGKAFVSSATRDQVVVFDAATRTRLVDVSVFGKDPRALAVSPDGSKVYAVVQRSGNGTTVLPPGIVPPPPPTNPALPAAPDQGLIVRADDPAWAGSISYSLPDHDVAEIDVASLSVTRYFDAVGTTNTAIAVHPTSGELWVANTEARNLVRFEPNLRGHAIDSRVTRITTGPVATVTPFDLNPGVNYSLLPNAAAMGDALAEPFGLAIDAAAGRLYVAAHGTDRVGVLDLAGNVLARIEVSGTAGAAVATRDKRGPRGLALHPTAPRLYVLNRLSDTLTVVDTGTLGIVDEQPIATVDAMPAAMREGRKFLYDAKLSGNGTMSCAACHIDADTDGIAWDLGDPGGDLENPPPQPFPFNLLLTQFHPMKGPMTTQTLRGLDGVGVLHWRGDRADFQAFNPAFDKLMGGAQLSMQDMDDYAAFATAIEMPPNPNQLLDRSLRTTPVGANEADGELAFHAPVVNSIFGVLSCNTCHTVPTGTNGQVIAAPVLQTPQQFKVAQLRSLWRKEGFSNAPGPQKSGFGFTHDGEVDSLMTFLALPVFNPWPASDMDDIVAFLRALDSGTAPAVGYQVLLDQATAGTPALSADAQLLTQRAFAGDLDLVGHGHLDGVATGFLYDPGSATFATDRTGIGPFTAADLEQAAGNGQLAVLFTAVPPGAGVRLGLDRDLDAVLDGDEAAFGYGAASPGCGGDPVLMANSEPFVGNAQFGYAMLNAQPGTLGVIGLSLAQSSFPLFGVTVLLEPTTAVPATIVSHADGTATHPFPIPANPALAGASVFAQALWLDPCGPQSWAASAGVGMTVQP